MDFEPTAQICENLIDKITQSCMGVRLHFIYLATIEQLGGSCNTDPRFLLEYHKKKKMKLNIFYYLNSLFNDTSQIT